MAFSRYKNTGTVYNDTDEHATTIGRRGLFFIRHHRSMRFKEISTQQEKRLVNKFHIWRQSDRFWKLSNKYYGDPGYWWVIARYNELPTESHLENGDTIIIPFPLQVTLRAMGY